MRRFLVVGCGGSGGFTLQFMMDQLRADLLTHGITTLPAAWQFVHVDVRLNAANEPGMPPLVNAPVPHGRSQTGRYIPVTSPGDTYQELLTNVEDQLGYSQQLGLLGGWRADPENVGRVPITEGAGQMRSVGRLATLARANRIREGLDAAWAALSAAGVAQELREVAAAVSPDAAPPAEAPPLVIVVSSMSGGAGASMVLEVCRLLSQIPGLETGLTALFLYTPDIFSKLEAEHRVGVEANTMAMTGELIAAQANASSDDLALLSALGLAVGSATDVPFKRVFPVGAKIGGDGADFGDGRDGVYRGLGRGLAALMMSADVTHHFAAYELTNAGPGMSRRHFGWGVQPDLLRWGSFGFASLALGRDRYAEYAAQRLARAGVDRLVLGSADQKDSRTPAEQARATADGQWARFCADLGLPAEATPTAARAWFVQSVGSSFTESASRVVADELGPELSPHGAPALRTWLIDHARAMPNHRQRLAERAEDEAYRWSYEWHRGFTVALEQRVTSDVIRLGIPVVRSLLERLSGHLGSLSTLLRDAASSPADVSALPAGLLDQLRAMPAKATVAIGDVLTRVINGHRDTIEVSMKARSAGYIGEILSSAVDGIVQPMNTSLSDSLAQLNGARAASPSGTGKADLKTDEYASWPTGVGAVSPRFDQAHNEVLLTDSADFEPRFTLHIKRTEPELKENEATEAIVRSVTSGRWTTMAPAGGDGNILSSTSAWRPQALPRMPGQSGDELPRNARYAFDLTPAAILSRARSYIERPGQPFQEFVGESLREFILGDPDVTGERARLLRDNFEKVLQQARPLVGVNNSTIGAMHPQTEDVGLTYKFSSIPFGGLPLQTELLAPLRQLSGGQTTADRYASALSDTSRATRIDVFSSYNNMSPLVFSSMLAPIATGWVASNTDHSRQAFWAHRRARPLPSALPMGDAQRRAMLAGWQVGRLTGRLQLPAENPAGMLRVFNDDAAEWLSFPSIQLTAEADRSEYDRIPATFESFLIAVAKCSSSPHLEPLMPFTVLRELWDDSVNDPQSNSALPSAGIRLLSQWIRLGKVPADFVPTAAHAGAVDGSPEERHAAILQRLQLLRAAVGRDFLAPGVDGAAGGGAYGRITDVRSFVRLPMMRELAVDLHAVLADMIAAVRSIDLTTKEPDDDTIKPTDYQ